MIRFFLGGGGKKFQSQNGITLVPFAQKLDPLEGILQ